MIVSRSSRWPKKQIFLAFVDAVLTAAAILGAIVLRLGPEDALKQSDTRFWSIVAVWGMYILAFYICGLYENESLQRPFRMLGVAAFSVALGSLFITGFFYATFSLDLGRGVFLGFAVFVFVAIVLNRLGYISANRRGLLAQRSLIIGTNGEARQALKLIQQHQPSGTRVFGLIHCGNNSERVGRFIEQYPIIGTLDNLETFIELYDIDRLILAATPAEEPVLLKRLRVFRYRGLHIVDFVSLHEELAQEIPLDHINDEWLFSASMHNSRIHIRRVKRLVDVVASLFGLLLSSPLAAFAAVAIKLTSSGPVMFRQERLGRDSRPFELLKFRTMVIDAEKDTGPVWAAEDDPRITPIGKFLRKSRIDEIPQLINVLRGDMSLVGPRPEREVFITQLSEQIPFYAERLLVPPGITGWAQVMFPYAASIEDSRRKLQYDLYYIKHMSFLLDVFIFAKTVKTMLFGRERRLGKKVTAGSTKPALKTETLTFDPSQVAVLPPQPPPASPSLADKR